MTKQKVYELCVAIILVVVLGLAGASDIATLVWKENSMTITYQDELGVISIADIDDIQFDGSRAYFTDENGTDFKVNVEHIISIEKEN